jgi:hypothetical protein
MAGEPSIEGAAGIEGGHISVGNQLDSTYDWLGAVRHTVFISLFRQPASGWFHWQVGVQKEQKNKKIIRLVPLVASWGPEGTKKQENNAVKQKERNVAFFTQELGLLGLLCDRAA